MSETVDKYACSFCDETFVKHKILTEHLQLNHKGEKFQCNQCFKAYPEMSSLDRHKKSNHDGLMYKCNVCGHQGKHYIK